MTVSISSLSKGIVRELTIEKLQFQGTCLMGREILTHHWDQLCSHSTNNENGEPVSNSDFQNHLFIFTVSSKLSFCAI